MFNLIKLCVCILLLSISAAPAMAGNNSGAAFSTWPDTGQTKCYNDTEEIPCPAPGDPFYGQDAQYRGPTRSYTKLDEQGNPLPDTAISYAMVRDNVTNLNWEIKNNMDGTADYTNPHDADNTYTWCDTNSDTNGGVDGSCDHYPKDNNTEDFIAALRTSNYGGHNDWRMPTVNELATLIDRSGLSPAISPIFHVPQWYVAWSSTTSTTLSYDGNGYVPGYYAFSIQLDQSQNELIATKSNLPHSALAVRGGQNPTENRYIDNGDGTVTDTVTCLQWQKATIDTNNNDDHPDRLSWQQALEVVENLSLAGKSDWRLPDINELRSLADYSRSPPSIAYPFVAETEIDAANYWSSTTVVSEYQTGSKWTVYSRYYFTISNPSTATSYARAVRGTQCVSSQNATWTPSAPLGRIYHTPKEGSPGTIFAESGAGFTPNNTVTLHFRNNQGEEQNPIQLSTDAQGAFFFTYAAPMDKPLGIYTWWAVDNATGRMSETIGYLIIGPPGTQTNIAVGSTTPLPTISIPQQFGTLISEGAFDPNKETFVVVHGWNIQDTNDLPLWVESMGKAIKIENKSPAKGSNVLYWNWQDKAKGSAPPYDNTEESGANLALALLIALPKTYAQNIHFIGHSLGTFVSTHAAMYAQKKELHYNNRIRHLVFLDSPNYSMLSAMSCFLRENSTGIFLENYISEFGVKYLNADVNVWMTKAMNYRDSFGLLNAHSYPYYWYTSSVGNFSDFVLDNSAPRSTVPWGFYWWELQNRSTAKSQYTQKTNEPHFLLFEGNLWDVGIDRIDGIVVDVMGIWNDFTEPMTDQIIEWGKATGKKVKILGAKTFKTVNDANDAIVNFTNHAKYDPIYGYVTVEHSSTAVLDIPVSIPTEANALTFGMEFLYGESGSMLEIFVNGNPVYLTNSNLALGDGLKMIPWINVEGYAGQTVTISLRLSNPNEDTEGKIKIDDLVVARIEDPDVPEGDYNNDGFVNITDTILALQVGSGLMTSNKLYQKSDVNNDDKIGIEEAIYSLQKMSGLK